MAGGHAGYVGFAGRAGCPDWCCFAGGRRGALGWVTFAGGGFGRWAAGDCGCLLAVVPFPLAFGGGALLSGLPGVGAAGVQVGGLLVDEVEECGSMGAAVFFFET